jgi:CRP-like cAMP-binding protein
MLRKNAKIDLLRSVPLFSDCTKSQLAEIAMIADEMEFAPGETLIREGLRGRQFFVVIDGSVKVTKKGRSVPIRGGTALFGEIALLSDAPTNATVTATSPVRVLVLADHKFRGLIQRAPGIQLHVLRSLAERLAPDAL